MIIIDDGKENVEWDTTAQDLHYQELGNSARVGGIEAYFRGIRKQDGLRGSG